MSGRVILVTAVGAASGSRAAAAALACAGSEPDRPGLLIDVGGRPPRPTLVASAGARELEERLAVHLPSCASPRAGRPAISPFPAARGLRELRAALPLVRESVAVIHLPPAGFRRRSADAGIRPTGALLRADLDEDRALTALAVRDLAGRGLRVKVLKHPLAWVPAAARCSASCRPAPRAACRPALLDSLLESEISAEHVCYGGSMTRKLTQRELRNNSGEMMRALDAGEDFVVTRNGKPVGELRPYKRRQFVPGKSSSSLRSKAHRSIDYEELRADIDRYVDQDPTPRYWVE